LLTCLLYRLLCVCVRLLARGGGERELEIVVLRHQVAILRRGGRRPQYTAADRALLAAASRLLPLERWSCFAVSPQTLRRWHRALLQGNRRRRARPPGRPPLAASTRSLILRLARENARWGYVRIQGELLKLGISVSATTIATVLRVSGLGPAPRRIGPSWSEFLRAQAQSMLGAGLPSEPGRDLAANAAALSAPPPAAATCNLEAERLSSDSDRGAVVPAADAGSGAAVGCCRRALSLRPDRRAAASIAAMASARSTKDTTTLLARADGSNDVSKTVDRTRLACERQPELGFSGAGGCRLRPAAAHNRPKTGPSRQLN
jgi:hypothetical protein